MSNLTGGVWEDVSCPLCPAGTAFERYLTCGDRLKDPTLHNHTLTSCCGCGLIFLSPRPPFDLAPSHHLQEGYDPFISFSQNPSITDRLYILAREWSSKWKRRLVLRQVPKGSRVLDVGCGTGEFLKAIHDVMICQGIEPEIQAGEWGRKNYNIDIKTGDLDSVPLAPNSFEMITLWHALEHIPEALLALQKVSDALTPNGKVLIALPNIDSYDADFYGPDWVALDAPRHLWHFTPTTIKAISLQAGFSRVSTHLLPLDHFYNVLLSEGIHLKSNPTHKLFSPLRMGTALAGSLYTAFVSGEGSGMYYILEK